jgi:hypothetical protein
MKKLLVLILSLVTTGCASTQYTLNNQQVDSTLKTVGTIVVVGVIAHSLADKNKVACKSYVSGTTGTSVVTTYKSSC